LAGYENTTDEPAIQTAPAGRKVVISEPPPSLKLMVDTNIYDYAELMDSLKGGTYQVIFVMKNGKYIVRHKTNGTYEGFLADVTAINSVIPKPGEILTNFPLYISFHDFDHFRDAEVVEPAWGIEDLLLYMPVGLYMRTSGTMSTGSIEVVIEERDGSGLTGLVDADFEVVGSNHLTSPDITVVSDDGAGVYTLTVQKGVAPANLSSGDWVQVRVNKGAGSLTTYLSNRVVLLGTGV
jgi:hypothetical protein